MIENTQNIQDLANDTSNSSGMEDGDSNQDISNSELEAVVDFSESWLDKVSLLANKVAEREGCVLYDLEVIGSGKARVLRVYIDRPKGENLEAANVGIEDCSKVSQGLSLSLDVEDIVPGGAYSLEVSTPGLDRKLKKPWHFKEVVGKKISVKTHKSLESVGVTDKKWKSAKTIEKILHAADENHIEFDLDGTLTKIPYELILKANLKFEIIKGKKK